jgi:acetolactate synthase I/II/III large subunit
MGIKYLLGYTGGAIMPTFDALPKFPSLTFLMCRNEQGATFMAQGYTRACGKLAPVLTTSGPGATNAITGVADAMMDSCPMLVVTGQVSTAVIGTDAFQESDVIGLMYPITKYATMPLRAEDVESSVRDASFIALQGRKGPVCIDFPKNVQLQRIQYSMQPEYVPDLPGFNRTLTPKSADITHAVRLINASKRPVALVGHGVILGDAGDELRKFIEKTQIPVALTLHGISAFPASHPLCLGMMGMHGEVEANRAIQNADLIIALGMRFDDRVTGKLDEYGKSAKIIHVEVDTSEINKNVRVDVGINAELKETLVQLSSSKDLLTSAKRTIWMQELLEHKAASKLYYDEIFTTGIGETGKLLMSRVIHELSEFTNGNDTVVSDVGQNQMFTAKFYKFNRFNTWFTSGGLGTMGFGLPAAIGVKLARPDEEVWCVTGDGGFQMNIQELGTVMQHNFNINILILNNSFLGMVKQWQNFFHEDRYVATELVNPDFKKLAEAYGIPYRCVESVDDIKAALVWAKQEQKGTIIEFICDKKENVFPMIPTGSRFEDMIVNKADAHTKLFPNRIPTKTNG